MTMRFFTPERWMRFQHTSEQEAFYSAQADWEQARAAYQQELNQVLPKVPSRLKRFAESECLHDAMILALWQGRSRLNFLLRPDPPTQELIQLTYTLVTPLRVNPSALPPEYRTKHAAWMYDEIGMEETASGKAVFSQTILLSIGWEVTIRFSRFDFFRPKMLLPSADQESLLTLLSMPRSAREA
jgi:hypothetical protein